MLGCKPLAQQPGRPDLFRLSSVRDCTHRLSEAGKALQKRLFFSHARMRGFRVVGSTDAVWLIITTPFFATLRARSGYDSGQGGRLSRHERFQSGTDSRAWRAADTGSLSALWSGVGNRVGQAITQENNLTAPLRMTRISCPAGQVIEDQRHHYLQ